MRVLVPDASVILTWVLQREDEPAFHPASKILEGYLADSFEIRLPTLWRYEVGNVLGLKLPQRSSEVMEMLLDYHFPEEPLGREYCLEVLRLMRAVTGVTFYDTAYHSLAIRTAGLCVTADRDYVKRAKSHGHIVMVTDWEAV